MPAWGLKEQAEMQKMNLYLHLVSRIFFQYFRDFPFGALDAGYLYIHPKHAIFSVSKNLKLKLKAL